MLIALRSISAVLPEVLAGPITQKQDELALILLRFYLRNFPGWEHLLYLCECAIHINKAGIKKHLSLQKGAVGKNGPARLGPSGKFENLVYFLVGILMGLYRLVVCLLACPTDFIIST